jgi:hypothetical protein
LVEFVIFVALAVTFLCVGAYWLAKATKKRPRPAAAQTVGTHAPVESTSDTGNSVNFVLPEFEWSGNSNGVMPLKILTYKQYECLEDARYGFRIVGLKPTELKLQQPHKTRGHSVKTVASLSRHGFLSILPDGGYTITDHGLNALVTLTVRY